MNEEKKKRDILNKIKKIKNIKIFAGLVGALLPFILILFIILVAAYGRQFPNFVGVTMVGRETAYGSSSKDLPEDLTTLGIDTWTDEEKQIFKDYERERKYYDECYSYYGAGRYNSKSEKCMTVDEDGNKVKNIRADLTDKFDISTVVTTINYQGVVNLSVFDVEYDDNVYGSEYKGEGNVINQHTRNFYEQAGQYTGNNFIIYPGERMLLGNLISNDIKFSVVEYRKWVCGNRTCDNASEIYSDWNYLGKITASNDEEAKKNYSVSGTIENLNNAISFGKSSCLNSRDKWLKPNYCFDLDTLYDEVFQGNVVEGDTESYLEDRYEATVPVDGERLIVGMEYIAVSVKKKINYDLYQKYLKEVYVPHIYINCDDCSYKNVDGESKKDIASSITTKIMQFAESFKMYNKEDDLLKLRESLYPISNGGGNGSFSGSVPYNYSCSNGLPSELTYAGHSGWDLNVGSNTVGTNVYPLFNGVVVTAEYSSSYGNCPPASGTYACGHCWGSYGTPALGNHVVIYGKAIDGNYYYVKYGHLSGVNVKVGDVVDEKTVLGQAGNTGCSTGPHLHIGLAYPSGATVNPYTWKKMYGDSYRSVMCSR